MYELSKALIDNEDRERSTAASVYWIAFSSNAHTADNYFGKSFSVHKIQGMICFQVTKAQELSFRQCKNNAGS